MLHSDDFDIDVDISPLLGTLAGPTLIDARWYELAQNKPERSAVLQEKIDRAFRSTLLHAQWLATKRRALDRRRAIRVPLLSRVTTQEAPSLISTDISLTGLRCSGRPTAPIMDIEFKVPGVAFPIDTRAEVVSFKDANVIPLVGLRFVNLDSGYRQHIAEYIERRNHVRRAA